MKPFFLCLLLACSISSIHSMDFTQDQPSAESTNSQEIDRQEDQSLLSQFTGIDISEQDCSDSIYCCLLGFMIGFDWK